MVLLLVEEDILVKIPIFSKTRLGRNRNHHRLRNNQIKRNTKELVKERDGREKRKRGDFINKITNL